MGRDSATDIFYERVWPHRADVLRFARFLTRDANIADDIAQDSLLKAFRSAGKLTSASSIRSWLLKIVRNTWLDRLRARAHRLEIPLEDLRTEPVAPEEAWWQSDATPDDLDQLLGSFSDAQVIDALLDLPEDMRWTLLLIDVEGFSLAEAAGVLEVPEGTVKSRCHRARKLLRTTLLPLARRASDAREE